VCICASSAPAMLRGMNSIEEWAQTNPSSAPHRDHCASAADLKLLDGWPS